MKPKKLLKIISAEFCEIEKEEPDGIKQLPWGKGQYDHLFLNPHVRPQEPRTDVLGLEWDNWTPRFSAELSRGSNLPRGWTYNKG